jgi:hypothetical protein
MLILIAGPYRSGTNDNPELIQQNLNNLEAAALPIFRKGHIPIIGEWVALPLIKLAGSMQMEMRPGKRYNTRLPTVFLKSAMQFSVLKETQKEPMKM